MSNVNNSHVRPLSHAGRRFNMYTDKIERLYVDQALDELKDYINDLSTSDESIIIKLNDKLARVEQEIDTLYDNAFEMAESLEIIEDALPK